jgi:hypothetical protein
LTGRRVTPKAWSDPQAAFTVPEDSVSGYMAVRTADGARSDEAPFKVERALPDGQIASQGFMLEDSGLPGFAFLVETDGIGMFGVSGFETLSTYELRDRRPHVLRNRLYLNQRIADLRVRDGHLFCVGDHGLVIYRCADLLPGAPRVVAAITGGSYYGIDARPDPAGAREGLLVALSEHAPRWGSHTLRVVFYQFVGGELILLGTLSRPAEPEERQFAVSLDPLNRKAYAPWWHTSWNAAVADVSFGDDHSLYVVKTTEGVWRLSLELDRESLTQRSMATAYYPGVQCGMDYRIMLHGWANPHIPTLQHPYGVVAAGDTAWVTGWSGKVQRLVWQPEAILRITGLHHRAGRFTLRFTSRLGDRAYHIETATHPGADPWTAVPDAVIRQAGRDTYRAEGRADVATTRFYRLRVSP